MTKYTPEATKALIAEGPVARAAYVRQVFERLGSKVLGYYFAESSEFDVVVLIDVPDDRRASVAESIALGALNWSSGMAASMKVTWLATPEQFEAALKTATGLAAPGQE